MTDIETILYNDMKRYALTMCYGNIHDAEDMVQDLAVIVYNNIDFYLNRSFNHLRTLMYKKLKWLKLMNYRAKTAIKRTQVEDYKPTVVESDAWGLMEKTQLQTALLKLTKSQSIYFRLRLDGYNLYEIGDMFSRTPETIYITIERAKNNLIKQLKAA